MPIYEFECQSCGHRFEAFLRVSDPPVDACQSCQGPVRKLFSPPAVIYKGSGFYTTDYARPKGGNGSDKDSAAKSEPKPEAPAPPKP